MGKPEPRSVKMLKLGDDISFGLIPPETQEEILDRFFASLADVLSEEHLDSHPTTLVFEVQGLHKVFLITTSR